MKKAYINKIECDEFFKDTSFKELPKYVQKKIIRKSKKILNTYITWIKKDK